MIKYKGNPQNNIVEIFIDGNITETDVKRITSQLKADLKKHGKLRILEQVRDSYDMNSMMLLKDILFGLSPTIDFTHAALVTDAKWMPTYTEAIDNVLPTKVKAFESAQIEKARVWLTSS